METIDVIVVDDSAVSRRALKHALDGESDIRVVETARNGSDALEKLESVSVDAVVLDLHMPVMGGLEFLETIRDREEALPVIIVSSRTSEGAPATITALLEGADACIAKPDAATGEGSNDLSEFGSELSSQLRSIVWGDEKSDNEERDGDELPPPEFSEFPAVTAATPVAESEAPGSTPGGGAGRPEVIGIAVSTGGPASLLAALEAIPADFPIPILIVQHMPPEFTTSLAERFDSDLAVDVREGRDGAALDEATIWIAPGDRHLTAERRGDQVRLRTTVGPKVNSCRPSADVLFEGLAEVFGERTLGVIMTGMGRDGIEGARAIRQAGGQIVVQDRESSVAWGMPKASLKAGIVDRVVTLEQLGVFLRRAASVEKGPDENAP